MSGMTLSSLNFNGASGITLTGVNTVFKTAFFQGIKGFSGASGTPVSNSGPVYLGYNTGQLIYTVPTGGSFNLTFLHSQASDLINMVGFGNSGDGLFITTFY